MKLDCNFLTQLEQQTEHDSLADVVRALSDVAIRLAKERDEAVRRFDNAVNGIQIDFGKRQTLDDIERQAILTAYRQEPSIKETAARLNISVRKLYYKLKEYKEAGYMDRERTTLCICDDDPNMIEALTFLFEGTHDLITASCVQEFTERFTPDVDLIITDLAMSLSHTGEENKESGFGLLKMAQEAGWDIPIVVISGHIDEASKSRAFALGAKRFIGKPFDADAIERVIGELIATQTEE